MQQNELMHYGVKGMRWGKRKASHYDDVYEKKAAMKTAKKEYDKAYNNAVKYTNRHPVRQYFGKGKVESDRRWENAIDKAEASNAAKADYKNAKNKAKATDKAIQTKEDNKIRDARKQQSNAKTGLVKEAKNYALATLSGDKKTKQAATRNASKLIDSYIDSKEMASKATSGEKKVATAMAVIGGVSMVAATTDWGRVGRTVMSTMYPGL